MCVCASNMMVGETPEHTGHPVQDFSQRGGDGQVESAVFVACPIHGMLDHVACGIDASFV